MEQYDVSIIVPVYNREEIIKPCIESINSQTYDKSKWEVIFVDDASTDNSIDAIESLIDKNVNYRILRRPVGSGNASAPRNEGINASPSKYVFFLDSDDYVDSKLLENGMAMALKNDSDMVYVKVKAIGRHMTSKPFTKGNIDDANPLENHLIRTLAPFKFVKLKLLLDNNILYNPSIVKAEDQIFFIQALSKSNIVSILADKTYYIQQAHEGDHLSKAKHTLDSFMDTILIPLNSIYMSNLDEKKKIMLYNAWLLRSVERLRDFAKKVNVKNNKFDHMFQLVSSYFNLRKDFFDLSQIYENEKMLVLLLLAGDFKQFHKIVNESKNINDIEKNIKDSFKKEEGFNKVWVFKNKVVVLDFVIDDNKIAFDLEVEENKKSIKLWLFSRNNADSLDSLKESAIRIKDKKILIFEGDLEEKNKTIDVIRIYLSRIASS
ncbi:glycosyltransferase family 2 protein [Psychrobacter sp. NG27]|uniref:glycosyltransferase family 2 protein n=1 Tax=Psychrobacter sp. NG27 TaxID=2781966 RepID=UPI0018DF26E7|nr:glycosyltransferase family 2 protein [Psychrobacter sp. NG27]MBI0425838.1 glycosyltransferase family 2 protein [Psychrobacter sp. NG27]